jgi:pyruvate kinase
MRHTKIISTVGPASDSDTMLDALIAAGTDIFRLNFSHGTHASHATTFGRIRAAASRAKRVVAILQDLSGPKIRTGALEGGRPLQVRTGDTLLIATGDFPGEPGRISTTFAPLAASVKPGDRLLLADGLVELRVEATDGTEVRTTVVEGGEIGEHKGINAPGIALPASAITPKDVDDLRFGLSLGVDMVAVSFVQSAADLRQARQLLADARAAAPNAGPTRGSRAWDPNAAAALGWQDVPLVAKLERPQALDHLDEILASCEAVMVARGDLGLEMPLERVPRVQKEITRSARRHGIPVIVATQVLESMTTEPRPTRAEVNDAANAVEDGVDAIMLAGETAVGAFAARAVQTLDAIIREAEATPPEEWSMRRSDHTGTDHAQAICEAAVTLANRGDAQAIVAVTRGGGTARRLSALRPRAPIIATTDHDDTARRLALFWGVVPVCTDIGENVESAGTLVSEQLVARGLVARGAAIVLVNISADLTRVDANYLKIQRL